jgi:rare lipoprotein A
MVTRRSIAILLSGAILAACHTLTPRPYGPGFTETGLASWYGADFHHKRTANGERFDMNGLTAAHRSLPFDSYVRVTNIANGRSVVVRINDRGPFVADRIIDLSAKAARQLGIKEDGVARVRIEVVRSNEAKI